MPFTQQLSHFIHPLYNEQLLFSRPDNEFKFFEFTCSVPISVSCCYAAKQGVIIRSTKTPNETRYCHKHFIHLEEAISIILANRRNKP